MSALNVLLVTYSFPPAGGVGVLRAGSFARYFPSEGLRVDVLTTRNASAVGTDPSLLSKIPPEVMVHRTITLDLPFAVKKGLKKLIVGRRSGSINASDTGSSRKPNLLKRLVQDILLPDPQVTWVPMLTRAATRIVKERNIDLVLITVPPFSSVLLVERLRKRYPTLPIVLDFRDEWLATTIDLVSFSRSDRAARIAHQIEATAVKDATAVVAVTDAARDEIRRRYPDESEHKFRVVPNGFDASMLGASEPITRPRSDDRVVVTYIGSVYGSTEPTTLVEALLALPSEVKSRLQIRFIGHIEEPRYRDSLLRLGDMVELNGFLPQRAALAAMKDSDYALLVSHDPLNVSAKFYDYVGAHKPILATIHSRGDVRAKLDELRAGWWADSRDVKGICRLFIDAVNRIDTLASEFRPELEKVAGYERGVLAHRYADLLREIAHWHNGVSPELPRVELAGGSCEL